MSQQEQERDWWSGLKHHGLLLGPSERKKVETDYAVSELNDYHLQAVRREFSKFESGESASGELVQIVMEKLCGFRGVELGQWERGSAVSPSLSVKLLSGDNTKPSHLWKSNESGEFPVFISSQKTLGVGKGRKSVSDAIQWLRRKGARLALVTNCRQWRLIYAGLDYEAWCEWDAQLWFEEGKSSAQLDGLRLLLQPSLYDLSEGTSVFASLVQDSRKGQGELSSLLGERVREAVEEMVRSHGEALTSAQLNEHGADIYRAAVRVVMRLVVILFAESREMLPLSSPSYFGSYSLQGLFEQLGRVRTRGASRLVRRSGAWPRIVALFKLVYEGSFHESLEIPAYGGELFESGNEEGTPIERALYVFENSCFDNRYSLMSDLVVLSMLEKLMRTKVRIRQGRGSTYVSMPVDFSQLSTEYIGVLYEGLLDYELRQAEPEKPVLFLAVGNEPALPLDRLEAMDDSSIKALFESLKKKSGDDGAEEEEVEEADDDTEESEEEPIGNESDGDEEEIESEGEEARRRATQWAMRACEIAGLVRRLRNPTPERELRHRKELESFANKLSRRVILPGEWYLVRWGGTRKGSGTFYTKPQLAAPTVARTLRPLAYRDVQPDDPLNAAKTPRLPEEILSEKVCDPGCGSGSFLVGSLKYLTDALYESLNVHGRLTDEWQQRPLPEILGVSSGGEEESLSAERLPCRPEDSEFEPRLKAVLRRYVVERCIYGVDLDPLAVELCRLALWIETLDRHLPFSFIDHKIKCGNSLVGAWFDRYRHYPIMAWKGREAGDKTHNNGVHYQKEVGTKAIKEFCNGELKDDLFDFLAGQLGTDPRDQLREATLVHDQARDQLSKIHALPAHCSSERAELYRSVIESEDWLNLKRSFDQWCACWFWPADQIEHAPRPRSFSSPSEETLEVVDRLAEQNRFFHWELEFPDVFRERGAGFTAIVGNPAWDTAKPSSMEFFSNVDPLYRSYGKQEALRKQTEYFENQAIEQSWIQYNAGFKAFSHFVRFSENPWGDPGQSESSTSRFSLARGKANLEYHQLWKNQRSADNGYSDSRHPFRHQGSADLNLYKLFLEQAHAIMANSGRMGFIVPSGVYSDHGTGALRELFLDHCAWEWLFGFENRDKVFDIDGRFKFNPLIVIKGGNTQSLQATFMRRKLEDWENAEKFATSVSLEQITRFSPKTRAILEIQTKQDLEILEKIYSNSVLLGDDGPDGWGITYAREFDMTNDSRLFPPRTKWEEKGYLPDEYSRWLLGNWRPIEELWSELGTRALAEGETRCAQPPYNRIPLARADIPEGILLSREVDSFIREEEIKDTALPLYEGRMIGQFDFSQKGWVSGKGRTAVWRDIEWEQKQIEPQYLMGRKEVLVGGDKIMGPKIAFMPISSATNSRTTVSSFIRGFPAGHSVSFYLADRNKIKKSALGSSIFSSFIYDFGIRHRLGGLNMSEFVMSETSLPFFDSKTENLFNIVLSLNIPDKLFSSEWISCCSSIVNLPSWKKAFSLTHRIRLEKTSCLEGQILHLMGLGYKSVCKVFENCDYPKGGLPKDLNPKGFWRVDKEKDPELRQTVLTQVAFHDLQKKIEEAGGDRDAGIEAFCNQNDGEGWMIPETLRLADYGLGHDERANEHQPVAERLGPRFFDWQLAQDAEESWKECHLHARNQLGEEGYRALIDEIEGRGQPVAEDLVQRPEPENPQSTFSFDSNS